MKLYISILLTLLTVSACAQKQTNNNQQLSWISKAAVGNYAPEGTLNVKDIISKVKGDTLSELTIVIDMKSLQQENKQLQKHLRNKDFFDVKKYPEAVFKLSKPYVLDKDNKLVGHMTIKNKTKEERITSKIIRKEGHITLTFNHIINRVDYGITFNSPSVFEKLKENAIADLFTLKGTITLNKE